jgi:pyrroline-5-carboxylate reductase
MKKLVIGFIGAGNIASSLIRGLLADGFAAQNIWATNPNLELLNSLKSLNIHTSKDNRLAVKALDVLVLAVKPNILKEVISEIADLIQEKKPLVISIAAGINLKTLHTYLQDKTTALIRCMPNTPTLLACGASGLFANDYCASWQKNIAESLFRSVGIVVWLKAEKEIDTVTALSGSGPAYFFSLMCALQSIGIELGLSKETASLLSQQTALGAARMAIESRQTLNTLLQQVSSRGGTTERALQILDQGHFSALIKSAVLAAKQRAQELTQQFENEI